MAKLDPQTIKIPQAHVDIKVEFYDSAEMGKLLNYPSADALKEAVAHGVSIPSEELLAYYLFHRKRPGKAGWRNYDEIAAKIERALSDLSEWIDFNGKSISTPTNVGHQDRGITEHLGEAIGLSVVNHVHRLTDADWDRIPEQPGPRGVPTFDYEVASDGKNIIQMEAKGCSTTDNSIKTASVSNHKADVSRKKQRISQLEAQKNYRFPANMRYGTITVLGENPNVPVRCLLVDPPAEADPAEALRLRLLQRMRFLRDWISFVSPRSQLASAVSTRVAALERLRDPFELANVPLRRGSNTILEFPPIDLFGHTTFFYNKTWVSDGPAGGVVGRYGRSLILLGFRDELIRIAAAQDFDALLEYSAPVGSVEKTVEIELSARRFRQLELPNALSRRSPKQPLPEGGAPPPIQISLSGELHYTAEGLVFGALPIPRDT